MTLYPFAKLSKRIWLCSRRSCCLSVVVCWLCILLVILRSLLLYRLSLLNGCLSRCCLLCGNACFGFHFGDRRTAAAAEFFFWTYWRSALSTKLDSVHFIPPLILLSKQDKIFILFIHSKYNISRKKSQEKLVETALFCMIFVDLYNNARKIIHFDNVLDTIFLH